MAERVHEFAMTALMIINNFVHDLGTGLWASTLLVLYLLRGRAEVGTALASALLDIMHLFFWIGIVSLVAVLATGGIRFRYYAPAQDGSEGTRKRLLIAKHVLFTIIFLGGTLLAYRWTYA